MVVSSNCGISHAQSCEKPEDGKAVVMVNEQVGVRHIGIVAGTAEGAALCYRTICLEAQAFLAPHAHPEITMHTFSLGRYLEFIEAGRWQEVASLLSQSSEKLAHAGADFIVCSNNTLHLVFDEVQLPIPWLHIADVVAVDAARRGIRRAGLLGTHSVMEGCVYRQKLERIGIDLEVPDAQDQARIHGIILTELIRGHISDASQCDLYAAIGRMKKEGCDAVILGCTELPLFVVQKQSVLPLLDSTRLLAQAAIRHAIGPRDTQERSRRSGPPGHHGAVWCKDRRKVYIE